MSRRARYSVSSYDEWLAAVRDLCRRTPEEMSSDQLDLAAALLYVRPSLSAEQWDLVDKGGLVPPLRACLRIRPREVPHLFSEGGAWAPFSVTEDWEAFGKLISDVSIVVGSHEGERDGKVAIWYSCHAFLSGTQVQAYGDLREIVAESAARLLKVRFGA